MKEWSKPELLGLNVQLTNGGGYGPPTDGVVFQVNEDLLLGTSGPKLNYPVVG